VLLMVQQHLTVWLWDNSWGNIQQMMQQYPGILAMNALGGVAAPLFITIAGWSAVRANKKYGTKTIVMRAVALLACGYLLNILVPSWFSLFSWGVLHTIGFAVLISPLLSRVSWRLLLLIGIVVVFVSPCAHWLLQTPFYYNNARMENWQVAGGMFRLMFLEGQFPVFPWLTFFIAGMLVARSRQQALTVHLVSFAAIAGIGFALHVLKNVLDPAIVEKTPLIYALQLKAHIFPLLTPLLLILSGVSGILLVTFNRLKSAKLLDLIAIYGKYSLTILITHIVLFRELPIQMGVYKSLSTPGMLLTMGAVIGAYGLIGWLWARRGFVGSFEWALRYVSGRK